MQDKHKGTGSLLKGVKSIHLKADFFPKLFFLNEKMVFHFIILNASDIILGHPRHLSSSPRRLKLRKPL